MSFDFSEPMTGFEQGDVTVSNGSVTAFSGSGRSYTATIAPAGAGTVTVDVAAHVAMDATGNPNMPAKRFSVRAEPASPNAPPVITDPGDKTYEQGEAITAFGITATDADSDPLTVTLSGLPSGLSYANDQVQGTVAADVAAKIYTVTIADASAGEGDPITFTVTLDKAVSGGLTVTPSFTDGTAEKGTDYSENTAALTFTGTAGETQSFTVETVEDEVTEEDETFTVSLTVSGTSATVTATDTATGTRPEKDPSKPLSRLKSPGSQYPAKSMNRGLVVGLGLRLLPGGVVLEIRSDENQHPHLLADPL